MSTIVSVLGCSPRDVNVAGEKLAELIQRYEIQLVDMGDAHEGMPHDPDQDNTLQASYEHGLPGAESDPEKNGTKW
jgi:hypothetical protein